MQLVKTFRITDFYPVKAPFIPTDDPKLAEEFYNEWLDLIARCWLRGGKIMKPTVIIKKR